MRLRTTLIGPLRWVQQASIDRVYGFGGDHARNI